MVARNNRTTSPYEKEWDFYKTDVDGVKSQQIDCSLSAFPNLSQIKQPKKRKTQNKIEHSDKRFVFYTQRKFIFLFLNAAKCPDAIWTIVCQ